MGEIAEYYADQQIDDTTAEWARITAAEKLYQRASNGLWRQGDGRCILITEMTDSHLENVAAYLGVKGYGLPPEIKAELKHRGLY